MDANRPCQICEFATRTRYLNQRESMQLQNTIKDLSCKQRLAFYRHVVDQNNLKLKLHEFGYEGGQRDLYKLLNKRSRENSTNSLINRIDTNEESDKLNSPSLLLHDLNASIEFEKSSEQLNMSNKTKKLNPYDEFCLQYCSKLQIHHDSSHKPVRMSLKQYSERMKIDIKVAIARSARNSHTIARRGERIY